MDDGTKPHEKEEAPANDTTIVAMLRDLTKEVKRAAANSDAAASQVQSLSTRIETRLDTGEKIQAQLIERISTIEEELHAGVRPPERYSSPTDDGPRDPMPSLNTEVRNSVRAQSIKVEALETKSAAIEKETKTQTPIIKEVRAEAKAIYLENKQQTSMIAHGNQILSKIPTQGQTALAQFCAQVGAGIIIFVLIWLAGVFKIPIPGITQVPQQTTQQQAPSPINVDQ